MYCKHCGRLSGNFTFCQFCGSRLGKKISFNEDGHTIPEFLIYTLIVSIIVAVLGTIGLSVKNTADNQAAKIQEQTALINRLLEGNGMECGAVEK